MTLKKEDVTRLGNARVLDSKGERIGRIDRPHVLGNELVGVRVRLDEALARLPTVNRDHMEVAPDFLDEDADGAVRMGMDFMDAISGHAIPRTRGGAVQASEAPPQNQREWAD